jgi:hypothetical protein
MKPQEVFALVSATKPLSGRCPQRANPCLSNEATKQALSHREAVPCRERKLVSVTKLLSKLYHLSPAWEHLIKPRASATKLLSKLCDLETADRRQRQAGASATKLLSKLM